MFTRTLMGEGWTWVDDTWVVDKVGKSSQIFEELQQRFGFVGGAESEWVKYLKSVTQDQASASIRSAQLHGPSTR